MERTRHRINGSKRWEKERKIMPIVEGIREGFINPLAYEAQIVKRLNSLQAY